MKKLILAILILFLAAPVFAAHQYLEKEYQAVWCKAAGGVTEYRLDCGARVDCLLEEFAVEFDFGPKWAESIGQALYYGLKTGRLPGIVLIMEEPGDEVFLKRLRVVTDEFGIRVWIMTKGDMK